MAVLSPACQDLVILEVKLKCAKFLNMYH